MTTSMRSMRSVGKVFVSGETALLRMSPPTWRLAVYQREGALGAEAS